MASLSQQPPRPLVVGTRGSPLALVQAQQVLQRLHALGVPATLQPIRTSGDRGQRRGVGVFVKELEEALLHGQVDLAVHSLKDMPTQQPPGLRMAAVLERADARDALVSPFGSLDRLPARARVGCGSPRRIAQLRALRPDLDYIPITGNVDTRLRKLDAGLYEAIVLALAGLLRMGWEGRATQVFSFAEMLPAPGQGAIALEVREGDAYATRLAQALNHWPTWWSVLAERAFLRALGGGCRVPIAAYAHVQDQRLVLDGLAITPDGQTCIRGQVEGLPADAEALGVALAQDLLRRGANRLVGSPV
ncbi:MAG: hydroxymethylbilane synthase [Dehalococcoidia bacterium]|nr:hydroxymethylbilane synthase [Dehalococcoidia bacterium]MDW8119325.1 hydroxymethylbilane synthase [Chloroflexota bacterium]